MSTEMGTVCVWESGAVHSPGNTDALARDIADALGATHDCVKVTGVDPDGRGVWMTVRIQAPWVSKEWNQ